MIKKIIPLILSLIFCYNSWAAGGSNSALKPNKMNWEFDGFFGRVDKQSAQRGFQVYKEVCSACHSLKLMSYRNLQQIGFGEDEVKQIASEYLVVDGPNDDGDMYERPALPSDRFVAPFANEKAARAANGGAYPPDLSLMVKARADGANYLYSLLSQYQDPPKDFELAEGKYYNPYFEGRQISMPPPIGDDYLVEYQDGTFPSKEQMIIDVVNFLQFAAEPEMEQRKQMGIKVITFLVIMFILLLAAKRMIWKEVK